MRDFIERLRVHPEHIRQRIALGTTVGFTGLIAVIWFGTLVTSGSLALNLAAPGTTPAASTGNVQTAVTETKSNFQQLLGAVGAANASSTPATLKPVGSVPPANTPTTGAGQGTNQNATNQRVISF